MRVKTIIACVLLTTLIGCTRIKHHHEPLHAAGMPLPIEVTVKHKPGQSVSGTVHHRTPDEPHYASTIMQLRADQLWAMVPTDHLPPNEQLQYYIDVTKDGQMTALGSPGAPYVVTLLDPAGMILAQLSDRSYATDDEHPVKIVLHANHEPIEQPSLIYQMPGVPGDVRASMDPNGRGGYEVTIPPFAVRPGTWRYAIEVPLEGTVHRRPPQGYRSFSVATAPPPAPEPVATGEADAPGQ